MTRELAAFLDEAVGNHEPLTVEPMVGGGSCEIFSLDRGNERWVLEANRPEGQAPALFHGDYKLDNVIYAPASPPTLLAVVDYVKWQRGESNKPVHEHFGTQADKLLNNATRFI